MHVGFESDGANNKEIDKKNSQTLNESLISLNNNELYAPIPAVKTLTCFQWWIWYEIMVEEKLKLNMIK